MAHPIMLMALQANIRQVTDEKVLAALAATAVVQLAELSGQSPDRVCDTLKAELARVHDPRNN